MNLYIVIQREVDNISDKDPFLNPLISDWKIFKSRKNASDYIRYRVAEAKYDVCEGKELVDATFDTITDKGVVSIKMLESGCIVTDYYDIYVSDGIEEEKLENNLERR